MSIELSPRQRQILQLLANGKESKEIARELFIGISTITTQLDRANQALGTHNRTYAVAVALRLKLIE